MSSDNSDLLASVVISTYNRADALRQTIEALGKQDVPPDRYEVVVVDDGSTDSTQETLRALTVPCALRVVRHDSNRGVSAGRNSGIRLARGRYLICLSDDLIVPDDFIDSHVHTLERFSDTWVVGGYRQLDSLRETPFGRYLDDLEEGFKAEWKAGPIEPHVWEMKGPTARNLSLRRSDLERTGLFDERFRTTCEDQDLAERARAVGIRFLYDESIECLHNDQAGDLDRYCRFQQRGASDTVLLLAKSPDVHGAAAIARVNGRLKWGDSPRDAMRKLAKAAFAMPPMERAVLLIVSLAERLGLPENMLRRGYRIAIGIALFRGWREGLRRWGDPASDRTQADVRARSPIENAQPH